MNKELKQRKYLSQEERTLMDNKKNNEISIRTASIITAASKYTAVIVQLVFSFVLARILTPEDYGIVAITTVFTGFFTILSDMGIPNGIVQDKTLSENEINGIFNFTLKLAALLALGFSFFSIPLSKLYKQPVLFPIGLLLAISLLFSTMNMVPNALILKDKQFVLIAKRNIFIPIITSIVTLVLAFAGWKYYALVMQSILRNAIFFALNYRTCAKYYSLKPQKDKNHRGLNKIKNYSMFQFAFNIVNYFTRNLDNLLVGKFFGAAPLGFYDKAYKLMSYPQGYLTDAITPVLHPILSEYQNDKRLIYEKYLNILKLLSLMGIFVEIYCHFSAKEIIGILYGDQWYNAVPYFEMLALSVWAQMLCGTSGSIFLSAGDTKRMFTTGMITTGITIAAISLGVAKQDLIIMSRNVALAFNAHFLVVMFVLICRTLKQNYLLFLKNFLPELLMFITMFLCGTFINKNISINNILVSAIVKFILLGSLYLLLCICLKQIKYLYLLIPKKRKHRELL